MAQVHCYNKGCGQTFDPENNQDDNCSYHPGVPVFHDALKGWSCCDKRSTDFTQFLSFPGCTKGVHSNVKPVEPEKPKVEIDRSDVVVEAPRLPTPKPLNIGDRPSIDEPLVKLKVKVGASLQSELQKLSLKSEEETQEIDAAGDSADETVQIGTSCKNNACKCSYKNEDSNSETCLYHPGVPVFHEGLKYWSCCRKKTLDFENFLNIVGCKSGNHKWIKPKTADGEMKACRFDWHQTGPNVCLSIFAKVAMPELTVIEANKVFMKVCIVFEKGQSKFEQEFILRNAIDPDKSEVKMLGTKVEINLRKIEAFHWPSLEMPEDKKASSANGAK